MSSIGDEDIDDTSQTGDPLIDALLMQYKWSQYAREHFSYSIPDGEEDYEDTRDGLIEDYPDGNHDFVFEMPAPVKIAIERSAQEFEKIITFQFNNEPGHEDNTKIRYGFAQFLDDPHGSAPAYAHPIDDEDGLLDIDQSNWMSGDIFLRDSDYGSTTAGVGSIEYMNIMHETGHAFGLKHGHESEEFDDFDSPALPENYDSMEFSIMTYRSYVGSDTEGGYSVKQGHYAQTLMMVDIAAIQSLYGADFTTQQTDTVYRWNTSDGSYLINGKKQWTPDKNVVFMTIWDGGGNDTYDLSAYTTNIKVSLNPGGWANLNTQTANLGDGNSARGNVFNALAYKDSNASLIENVLTGTGDDRVTGNIASNRIETGDGKDVVFADFGDDVLIGGAGRDELHGGGGHDLAGYTTPGGVNVRIDQIGLAALGKWRVEGFEEGNGDLLDGIEGFRFGNGSDTVVVSGNGSVDLFGNGGNDRLTGGNGSEIMIGGAGTDTFTPNAGVFFVFGGTEKPGGLWAEALAQNDLLVIDKSALTTSYTLIREDGYGVLGRFTAFDGSTARGIARLDFTGGSGADTADGGLGNNIFSGGGDRDLFRGNVGSDIARGGSGSDTLYADDGDDALSGDGGNDYLSGASGNDTLDGGTGDDLIEAGAGNDTIRSGRGGDQGVFGDAGRDILIGNIDGEVLNGGAGNDRLTGFAGNDALTGATGADRFIFAAGDGKDVIFDFDAVASGGQDILDVSAMGFVGFGVMLAAGVKLRDDGENVIIDFGKLGLAITLQSVDFATVDAGDFAF